MQIGTFLLLQLRKNVYIHWQFGVLKFKIFKGQGEF